MVAIVSAVTASANSNVVTPGQTVASGEVAYIAYTFTASTPGSWPSAYTPPLNFTEIAQIDDGGAGGYSQLVLFRRVAGGSEPSTYTVGVTGGSLYNDFIGIVAYSGVDNTTPDGTPVTLSDGTSNTTFDIPAMTTANANSYDLVCVCHEGGTATVALSSWGSSLIERIDTSGDFSSLGMADALRVSAGVQAATSVTSSNADYSLAIRVEINNAAGVGGLGMPLAVHHMNQMRS